MEPHSFFEDIFNHLSSLSPGAWCQAFFLFAGASVLAVAAVPGDARALLADYGARKADSNSKPKHPDEQSPTSRSTGNSNDSNTIGSKLLSLLDALTTATQVPHSWFAYFYVLSMACSAFWLLQYLLDGEMLRFLAAQQQDQQPQDASATFSQSALGWLMMTAQAGRRVFEHAFVIKPSRGSSMWVVHWVLGLGFYVVMSVAVWIEGSASLLDHGRHHDVFNTEALIKMAVAVPAFLYAWINQYRCHAHLAGLKKYSLPEAGMFRSYVCPHYTCECLLYLAMAVATAPGGSLCNRTLLCAVFFIVINLGVTAAGTRKWYASKFGAKAVEGKWNMIPFMF